MDSAQIRAKFLKFFEDKGHKVIPSASLVPENDPSVLFTTAGMQQFKPYYINPELAPAKNVVSIQKCIRTSDIDEVGDESHLTFFEMLGNFSFGGYWKEEAIKYAHEFITSPDWMNLKIDYVSVFAEEGDVPADKESEKIWKSIDSNIIIKKAGREDNFWGPTGGEGPCGPTTEVYVDGVEIWNIVFNEYYQNRDETLKPLDIKGIDTGMGLERLAKVAQNVSTVFETDLFEPIIREIKDLSAKHDERAERIVADHVRAATHIIEDGVEPSNVGRGYILRRLIRRAMRYADLLGMPENINEDNVVIKKEEDKFRETIEDGLKEFEKGKDAFTLFSTYGFPFELTKELAKEKGIEIDEKDFQEKFLKHQEISRAGSEQKFKGGLANTNDQTIKLHTAHHLLLSALQEVLGKGVKQKGSNITEERLRIDFVCPRKLTVEEIRKVEEIVGKHIEAGMSVTKREMPLIEAETLGAEMEFGAKYPEIVSLYFIEDKHGNAVSKEFCGGPHVSNTSELGKFKILKEEAVSAGVRRIKAVLE